VITDARTAGRAIIDIRPSRLAEALGRRRDSPSWPGSQGCRQTTQDVTTDGPRCTSDTTRRRAHAALNADACEIYKTWTAVVFTADPRSSGQTRRDPADSYEEMLREAPAGEKVLTAALRGIRGGRYGVPNQ